MGSTLRNYIMGSTLVATTTVRLCAAIFAFDSRVTYGTNYNNYSGAYLGSRREPEVDYKFDALLLAFVAVFACQFLSIGFLNQVGILINIITMVGSGEGDPGTVTPELVCVLLEKGLLLSTLGNRLLYTTLPLTLWIFGATPVLLCSIATIPILYSLDTIHVNDEGAKKNDSICC